MQDEVGDSVLLRAYHTNVEPKTEMDKLILNPSSLGLA